MLAAGSLLLLSAELASVAAVLPFARRAVRDHVPAVLHTTQAALGATLHGFAAAPAVAIVSAKVRALADGPCAASVGTCTDTPMTAADARRLQRDIARQVSEQRRAARELARHAVDRRALERRIQIEVQRTLRRTTLHRATAIGPTPVASIDTALGWRLVPAGMF